MDGDRYGVNAGARSDFTRPLSDRRHAHAVFPSAAYPATQWAGAAAIGFFDEPWAVVAGEGNEGVFREFEIAQGGVAAFFESLGEGVFRGIESVAGTRAIDARHVDAGAVAVSRCARKTEQTGAAQNEVSFMPSLAMLSRLGVFCRVVP